MATYRRLSRVGAALAGAGLIVGLTAIPAASQVPPEDVVTLSGSGECRIGIDLATWDITFTLHNNLPVDPEADNDVNIISSTVTIGDEEFDSPFEPNPVPAGDDATTGGTRPAGGMFTVTITVEWTAPSIQSEGTDTFDLLFEDTCVAPETPETPSTPSTASPAVQAVAVTPAFTG